MTARSWNTDRGCVSWERNVEDARGPEKRCEVSIDATGYGPTWDEALTQLQALVDEAAEEARRER